MNFIGGGRSALFTGFFGLFSSLVMFCVYLLFYSFAAAVGIVYYMLMGMRWLYQRHRVKKTGDFSPPPMPVMNRVK